MHLIMRLKTSSGSFAMEMLKIVLKKWSGNLLVLGVSRGLGATDVVVK